MNRPLHAVTYGQVATFLMEHVPLHDVTGRYIPSGQVATSLMEHVLHAPHRVRKLLTDPNVVGLSSDGDSHKCEIKLDQLQKGLEAVTKAEVNFDDLDDAIDSSVSKRRVGFHESSSWCVAVGSVR